MHIIGNAYIFQYQLKFKYSNTINLTRIIKLNSCQLKVYNNMCKNKIMILTNVSLSSHCIFIWLLAYINIKLIKHKIK